MAKEKENQETQEVKTDALAIPVESSELMQEVAFDSPNAFIPSTREQIEFGAHLNDLRQSLEEGIGGGTKPIELAEAGTVFDIVDAYMTTMTDNRGEIQDKVVFKCVEQDTLIEHKVMQSSDRHGIRRKYAEYFGLSKAAGVPAEPLVGYRFVEGTKVTADNKAIILERVPRAIGA